MKIKSISKSVTAASVVILSLFSACKKEVPAPVSEQENLNVLKIKIGTATFTWSDLDGPGGNAPKIDTIKLSPNASLATEITIQDGSVNPVKDFTPEIIAEDKDHLFVYKPTGNLTFSALSKDANGKDFGQTATVKTTTAGSGSLQIILKHLPDKSSTNPAATGESDIDVTFPVVIR